MPAAAILIVDCFTAMLSSKPPCLQACELRRCMDAGGPKWLPPPDYPCASPVGSNGATCVRGPISRAILRNICHPESVCATHLWIGHLADGHVERPDNGQARCPA